MADTLTFVRAPAIVLVAGLALAAVAWRFDVLNPPAVAAARRRLELRGFLPARPLSERMGERIPLVRQIAKATSLTRLLAISGRGGPPGRWVAATAGLALLVLAVFSGLWAAAGAAGMGMPFWLGPAAAAATLVMSYMQLASAVRRRQRAIGLELGDMTVLLGVLVGPGGVAVEDAVLALARCTRRREVFNLLHGDGWQQLIAERPRTQFELFARISDEYEVPAFRLLGDAIRSVTVKGLDPLEQYTNLATATYEARLADAQAAAAKARIKLAIPIAGMVLPLMILLTAPLVYAIIHGLSG